MLSPISCNPGELKAQFEPSISMSGDPANPGCVGPSTIADSKIFSEDVGLIVFAPDPMLKTILSWPGLMLAALIASRKLQSASQTPSFVSAVFVTVKVLAWAAPATPSNRQIENS